MIVNDLLMITMGSARKITNRVKNREKILCRGVQLAVITAESTVTDRMRCRFEALARAMAIKSSTTQHSSDSSEQEQQRQNLVTSTDWLYLYLTADDHVNGAGCCCCGK